MKVGLFDTIKNLGGNKATSDIKAPKTKLQEEKEKREEEAKNKSKISNWKLTPDWTTVGNAVKEGVQKIGQGLINGRNPTPTSPEGAGGVESPYNGEDKGIGLGTGTTSSGHDGYATTDTGIHYEPAPEGHYQSEQEDGKEIDKQPEDILEPTEDVLARQARKEAANEEDAQRRAAYLAARNTGANRAAASAVSGNQTNEGTQTQAQSALRNTATGTQADYLNKMGYANALGMEAENKQKGAFLNTLGGIFSGVGQGASVGASLGGGV